MTRRHLATACTLLALAWASLGVAWYPTPLPPPSAVATDPSEAAPVRGAAVLGIGTLCAMAAAGFRRERRARLS